jgi:hypothetical protein
MYKLNTGELTPNFITLLKTAYPGKEVEIIVQEVPANETEYLLSSPVNRERLLQAVDDIRNEKNLVPVSIGQD